MTKDFDHPRPVGAPPAPPPDTLDTLNGSSPPPWVSALGVVSWFAFIGWIVHSLVSA